MPRTWQPAAQPPARVAEGSGRGHACLAASPGSPLTVHAGRPTHGATRLLWGLERVQEHGDAPPHQPFTTTPSTPAARRYVAQRGVALTQGIRRRSPASACPGKSTKAT